MAGITFLGCTIELNQGNSLGGDLALVGVAVNAQTAYKLEILSCYFEAPPEGCEQFLRFQNCPTVTVDNCLFTGNNDEPEEGPERAIAFIQISDGANWVQI